MFSIRSSLVAALAASGLVLGAGMAQAQIKIATAGPMTGQYGFGAWSRDGVIAHSPVG